MNRLSHVCIVLVLAVVWGAAGCSSSKEAPPVTAEAEQQAKDLMQKSAKPARK